MRFNNILVASVLFNSIPFLPARANPVFLEDSLDPPGITEENRSPFEVDLMTDLSLTLTGFGFEGAHSFLGEGWGKKVDPDGLDAGVLNGLDRGVVGNQSSAAQLTSDMLLSSAIVLPHLLDLADVLISDPADGMTGYAKDSLVLLETVATNFIVCNLVKFGVRRPRPYAYLTALPESERGATEASLSFFSGHTSITFSMATAYSYLFTLRHPDSRWVIPVWATTHALAATTAVMRVEAGKHFWTDVLTGAAVGSAIGFMVPWMHTLDWGDGLADGIRFSPALYEGGMGVNVMAPW